VHGVASGRLRYWVEARRDIEKRKRNLIQPGRAMARMKEANPHLSDEVARTSRCKAPTGIPKAALRGSLITMARAIGPFGHNLADIVRDLRPDHLAHSALLGLKAFAPVPENDPA